MADVVKPSPPSSATDLQTGITGSMIGKYYCRLLIGEYSRPKPFVSAEWNPKTNIYLPLPDSLRDTTSLKYSGTDMESVGDLINGSILGGIGSLGLRNLGSVASKAAGSISGATVGAALAAGKMGGLSDTIGAAVSEGIQSAFPASTVQSAFEQSFGVAPNPNPAVAFQGSTLREFPLTWTFFPKSQPESVKIKAIINTLKRSSLPENSIKDSAAILNYPHMCQLNFFPWDAGGMNSQWYWSENSIIKIKKCMMSSVDVDYNPSNVPGFFDDNSPVAIRLQITFSEIEYMLAEDWGGGSGFDGYEKLFDKVKAVGTALSLSPITAPLGGALIGIGAVAEAVT